MFERLGPHKKNIFSIVGVTLALARPTENVLRGWVNFEVTRPGADIVSVLRPTENVLHGWVNFELTRPGSDIIFSTVPEDESASAVLEDEPSSAVQEDEPSSAVPEDKPSSSHQPGMSGSLVGQVHVNRFCGTVSTFRIRFVHGGATGATLKEHLDAICAKYFVPEEVHPQLPSSNATMHERPAGKVGMYTRFFDYANYCIPFSTFFVSVLSHRPHSVFPIEMDLNAFIRTADPRKVRIVERERAENERPIVTVAKHRTVPYFPPSVFLFYRKFVWLAEKKRICGDCKCP
ncbi:hypothetical protein Tco_0341228 [Tanacetum coccineum]